MHHRQRNLPLEKETLRQLAGPELQLQTQLEVMPDADLAAVQGGCYSAPPGSHVPGVSNPNSDPGSMANSNMFTPLDNRISSQIVL